METNIVAFHLNKFDGPLDLLISLIQKNKIDIYDIPIVEITEQYLDYIIQIERIDLELSSEFLIMASQLLLIKSKMLLPQTADEEEEDPRDELVRRLLEYQQIKLAATSLEERQGAGDGSFTKAPSFIEPQLRDFTLKNLDIERLQQAMTDVLKRHLPMNRQSIKGDFEKVVQKQRITIISKVKRIIKTLKENHQINFFDFFEEMESRDEVIAGFLAVLELLKLNRIEISENTIIWAGVE